MSRDLGETTTKSDVWRVLKTPRLLPTSAAHGLVEAPYFLFPALLLLIQAQFKLSSWQMGLLGAGPMLIAGFMAPLAGTLGDRIQKTSVITLALGLSAFASALIGFFGDTLLILAVGLGLFGISSALYHPAGFGVVSQSVKQKHSKSRMFAVHGVGGSLGAGIGPLSVGLLLTSLDYSWQKLYLIWMVPLFLYAFSYKALMQPLEGESTTRENLTWRSTPQASPSTSSSPVQKGWTRVITRGLLIIVIFVSLLSLGRGSLSFFLPAFLSEVKQIPIAEAALIYSSAPLFGIVGQMIGGSVADKTSEKVIIEVVLIVQVVVIILIYAVKMTIVLLGAFCLLGAVTAALWPATASLTASSSTKENRGAAYGIYMTPQTILGAIAPIIGGFLKGVSYFWLFGYATILLLSGVAIIHAFSEKTATAPLRTS